jgi:hypothetical protein
MCQICGGAHDAALVTRPAHRLAGFSWLGDADDAGDAMRSLLGRAREAADAASPLWRSPTVCLTWSLEDDTRHFAGFALDEGADALGLDTVELPEMEFLSRWHGEGDGAVVMSYAAMFEILPSLSRSWETQHFHHREEYPVDVDPASATAMRIMLPVKA